MDAVVSILYWVKLAVLIVIVLLALWGAVRASRLRAFVAWRAVVQALLAIAAFAIFSWLAGVVYGPLWAAVAFVIGIAYGFVIGRAEHTSVRGAQIRIKRSALVAWLWAIAVILVTLTLLFGSSFLFGAAMVLMALAVGAIVGQVAGEFSAVKKPAGMPASERARQAETAG
jgi:hypothetical protein